MEELIKLQEIYIQLLIAELEDVVPIAHIHGWRSKRFEEGELIRQKMKEQKEKVGNRFSVTVPGDELRAALNRSKPIQL